MQVEGWKVPTHPRKTTCDWFQTMSNVGNEASQDDNANGNGKLGHTYSQSIVPSIYIQKLNNSFLETLSKVSILHAILSVSISKKS